MKQHQLEFLVDKQRHTLTIRREFSADRQLVWDCYTKSQLLDQWFAPKPLTTKTKSMDFREGGHWHYAMVDPNGAEYWSLTSFLKIKPIDYYTALDAFSDEAGGINEDLPRAEWQVTCPEHITKWNFAHPSWHCPSASNDMQVGGKYSARMEARDGSFGFDFEAVYNKIINGREFTYTMPDGRAVTVVFSTNGKQTEVVVTFDPEDQNPIEMQKTGWQAILDNFKHYTEES